MASEHKDYNNKSSMSSSIRSGFIASILMIILTMSFYWILGAGSRPVIVWNHIVLLIIMYSGVKTYKKTKKDEVISFKQCYTSGLIIGLSAAFIFGVFMMIYTKYIDKDLIQFFIRNNEIKFKNFIKGDELQHQITILVEYSTPFWMGVKAFAEVALLSLFMPLLMGMFLKKDKIEETTNN